MKTARVIAGPSVWIDRVGEVLLEDGEYVVVRIEDRDDAGHSSYDVRFPKACVRFEEAVPAA